MQAFIFTNAILVKRLYHIWGRFPIISTCYSIASNDEAMMMMGNKRSGYLLLCNLKAKGSIWRHAAICIADSLYICLWANQSCVFWKLYSTE